LAAASESLIARPSVASVCGRAQRIGGCGAPFAAAGIVFVHATQSDRWSTGEIFSARVPFYLFASLYFQSLSLAAESRAHAAAVHRQAVSSGCIFRSWRGA